MENSTDTKRESIRDIDNLFQFVVTVSIFFLTFIEIFFKYINSDPNQMSYVEFKWANMPIAMVTAYIVFRIFRKQFKQWVLKVINTTLLLEMVSIATVITVLLANGNQITSYPIHYLLIGSLWIAMSLSTIIFLFISISAMFFKEKNLISN